MGQDGIDLETSLGYLLKEASAALRAAMEEALRPLGMTVTHYSCLELLAQRPGSSSSELARGAFVTRQSMNVLLKTLERDGIVTRPAEAPVGKVLPVRLTPRGRRSLEKASTAVRSVELRMLTGITDAEQSSTFRVLQQMARSLRDNASANRAGYSGQAGDQPTKSESSNHRSSSVAVSASASRSSWCSRPMPS